VKFPGAPGRDFLLSEIIKKGPKPLHYKDYNSYKLKQKDIAQLPPGKKVP
jgi:hypothetical protein